MGRLQLLGTLCLCLALNGVAEEPPTATVDEAAGTTPKADPDVPIPFDDTYTINGTQGKPISQVLNVLANDYPSTGLTITQLKEISPPLYGYVTFTESSVLYQVESYDGTQVTEYFKYTVADASGKTAEATVAVTVQPSTPTFALANDVFNLEWPRTPAKDQRVRLDVLANDTGSGLVILGLKVTGSMNGKPVVSSNKKFITYTVAKYSGAAFSDIFMYEVTDAFNKASKIARVVVNVAPSQSSAIVANDDSYTIRASAGQTISKTLFVLTNDTGSGPLTVYDITPLPAGTSLKGAAQISADKQSIEYLIAYDGTPFSEALRYRVQDASGVMSSARVDIAVGNLVQPLAASDDSFGFTLKAGSAGTRWDLAVLNNDKGEGMYVASFFPTSDSFRGVLSITAGGQAVTYRLPQPYNGIAFTDSFTYVVRDSAGSSAQASVNVVVSPAPTPGTLKANPDSYYFTLNESGGLLPSILDVMANDTGNGIYIAGYRTSDFYGNLTWDRANNYFVYEVQQFRGSTFSWYLNYTIRDVNNNPSSTRATITVANTNAQKLMANDDSYSYTLTPGSTSFKADLNVLSNDAGVGKYVASYVTTSSAFKGTVTIGPGGQYITYRLPGQYNGTKFTDTLTYFVRDNTGASAQARVSVRIAPDSSPPSSPKANPDTYHFQLNGSNALSRTVLDVVANDMGDGVRITSYTTSDYIGVLTLDKDKNYFLYSVAEYTGGSAFTWQFNYTIRDTAGNTASTGATVKVDPGQGPLPVVLRDDAFNASASAGSIVSIKLNVLDNDMPSSGLRIVGYNYIQATYGELTVSPTFLTYKLNTQGLVAGTKFTDKYRYIVVDASGTPEYNAVVTINVAIS